MIRRSGPYRRRARRRQRKSLYQSHSVRVLQTLYRLARSRRRSGSHESLRCTCLHLYTAVPAIYPLRVHGTRKSFTHACCYPNLLRHRKGLSLSRFSLLTLSPRRRRRRSTRENNIAECLFCASYDVNSATPVHDDALKLNTTQVSFFSGSRAKKENRTSHAKPRFKGETLPERERGHALCRG